MAIRIRNLESGIRLFFKSHQESESAISVRILLKNRNPESVIFDADLCHFVSKVIDFIQKDIVIFLA